MLLPPFLHSRRMEPRGCHGASAAVGWVPCPGLVAGCLTDLCMRVDSVWMMILGVARVCPLFMLRPYCDWLLLLPAADEGIRNTLEERHSFYDEVRLCCC